MPQIWEPRDNFALEKYKQTRDVAWLDGIESRRYELKDYIPFMVSDRKELVCLPKEKDAPSLLLGGSKRTGKTLLSLSISEGLYHNFRWNTAFLNDMTRESYNAKWGPRCRQANIIDHYAMFRVPKMMPFVHVIPMSKDVLIPPGTAKWKVCLTMLEVLDNPEEYLEVKESGNYLSILKKDLRGTDFNLEIIERTLIKNKAPKQTIIALMTRLKRLYEDGILDICQQNHNLENYIKVKPEDDDMFHIFDAMTGLMVAGAVPILHTDHIVGNRRFFVKYLTSQVEKILINQMEHPYFVTKKKKTCLIIDELTGISRNDRSGENPVIRRAVIQGGPMGLGTIYCTQNPSKVDKMILSNTKYVITCQNSKTEAQVITNEFGLAARYAQEIVELNKRYRECIAFTSEKFRLFDIEGNSYYDDSGPIKGTYIFPSSQTLPPRAEE